MKNIFKATLILFIAIGFSLSTTAQTGYELSVGKRTLNFKDSSVFVLEVHRAMEKDVIASWKKIIEKNKIKAVTQDDQIVISQVVIESIDDEPIDIYSTVVQNDKSVKLYSVFIVDRKRVDPNSEEGAAAKVRKLLANFGSKVYQEVLTRELKEKQDALKELEKAREKNLKDQDKIVKSIQKDSLKIGSEKTEIGLFKDQLKSANDRYTAQKNKMAGAKYDTKEQSKAAKDELKDLDKARKGIEKDIEKHNNEILSLKTGIRDDWYDHEKLKTEEGELLQKITDQNLVVKSAEEELNQHKAN